MSKLERIQVAGYKSISNQDLELGSLNVLIGANGAGKSNFIEVFKLLNNIVDRKLQPELPHAILLDEPELGLHPYAISVLADLLRSAAQRTQVIVSMQSVTLVNQLDPEDVIVVDRRGGESVFRRLSSEE